MSSALEEKTSKGVRWSFADNVITQGITFLVGIVLARLLSPEDYGLIGIITIFIAISNSIVDSGFSSALIRKKDADGTDYNTVFYTNLGFSAILFIILFLGGPLIADFFGRVELVSLTRVMGAVIVINAFGLIQRTILTKSVDFKRQTKISFAASVVSGLVGIAMAFLGCGVWSLVWQQISRQLLNTVLLWVYNSWHPSCSFSFSSFKSLFGFGWKLLVSGLIDTIWNQIFQIVIGKCYSPQSLGQYTRAQQFSNLFSSNLTSVVQRVSYPVLSSIQNERERLKDAYKRIIRVTMLVTFPCMIGLAVVSKSLVFVLIGDQWGACATMLPLICFCMVLYPLHAINLNMLMVNGRSDLFLKLEIIKKVIAAGPILLGIFVGIYWMLAGSIVIGVIAFFLNSHYSGQMIGYSSMDQVRDLLPSFSISMFMGICVYLVSFVPVSDYVILPMQIIMGGLIFVGLCRLFRLPEYSDMKQLVVESINKLKQ